jgi:hypothetical protein
VNEEFYHHLMMSDYCAWLDAWLHSMQTRDKRQECYALHMYA